MLTRRWLVVLAGLALAGGLVHVPTTEAQDSTVRILFFWDPTCSNCEVVIHEVLPPLEEQYGPQLELVMAQLSALPAYDLFTSTVDHYQVSQERQGVPLMVVGDQVLAGQDEIAQQLPREIEAGLAAGGVDVPDFLGLTPELAAKLNADSETALRGESEEPTRDPVADAAALAVLSLMGLSLVYVGLSVRRAPTRTLAAIIAESPRRLPILIPILAVSGLGVSGYLSYVELTGSESICPIGNCNVVAHSPYSELFGIPVAVLGFLSYVTILGLWGWGEYGRGTVARTAPFAIFGVSFFGTLFSVYLTYLEPFVIKAVCFWCLASAVIITAILLVSLKMVLPETSLEPDEISAAGATG